ncbi:Rho GTPase activation protein [Cladochytrium replicatum]|nr:Rho GTPase activation protein [Cladochytrium replicatum]
MKTAESPDNEVKFQGYRLLVMLLPRTHAATLQYFLSFLLKVVEKREINGMDTRNIATIIGPNILRPKPRPKARVIHMRHERVTEVVQLMIERQDELWQVTNDLMEEAGQLHLRSG